MAERLNNNKRLFKNTLMMFFRMFLIMGVTLYTSRVILEVLGVNDYGIYNIVAGIIVSFAFIQNSLNSATQRFLSYELGKCDNRAVRSIYNSAVIIHAVYAFVAVLLLESIGTYFLNNGLNIPEDRIEAANISFHFVVATFVVSLLRIPSNALIIAKEKMSFYALVSIFDVVVRLAVVYLLTVSPFDNLVTYSALLFVNSIVVNICYYVYCKSQFDIPPFELYYDLKKIKEIIAFCSWNILGGLTGVAGNEGPNFILNIYWGVGINAAMGIAKQVSSAVYTFTSNFQTAFNPQIVKLYSANQRNELDVLVRRSAIISFLLIAIVSFPLLYNMDMVMALWLKNVPEYASVFCVILVVGQLLAAIASPLWMLAYAEGHIRNYQISISIFNLLPLPFAYVVLKYGAQPQYALLGFVLIKIMILVYRIHYLQEKINFDSGAFYSNVLAKIAILSLLDCIVLGLCNTLFDEWICLIVGVFASTIVLLESFYIICLDATERKLMKGFLKMRFIRLLQLFKHS